MFYIPAFLLMGLVIVIQLRRARVIAANELKPAS